MTSKKVLLYAFVFVALLAQLDLGWACGAEQAVKSLMKLKTASECCITPQAYLQAYEETEEKVNRFLASCQAETRPSLVEAITEIRRHYEIVAFIYGRKEKGLICREATLSLIISEYPDAGRDFDDSGAMLRDSSGRGCLSPALLVPLIFHRADQELQKIWKLFFKGSKISNESLLTDGLAPKY